jgi:predicted HD phosphohydrolase
MSDHASRPRSTFTVMAASTREDWQERIMPQYLAFAAALPDRVLAHLRLLDGDHGGFPVDRLTHCLQTAMLAAEDGRDEEYVVCALVHDIGDTLGPWNHPEVAACILRPFVSPANCWMVEKHGIFQGYYFFHHVGMDRNMRDQFRSHEHYARAEEFCAKYDGPAFDSARATPALSHFEPMLRRVLAQPKQSIYTKALE